MLILEAALTIFLKCPKHQGLNLNFARGNLLKTSSRCGWVISRQRRVSGWFCDSQLILVWSFQGERPNDTLEWGRREGSMPDHWSLVIKKTLFASISQWQWMRNGWHQCQQHESWTFVSSPRHKSPERHIGADMSKIGHPYSLTRTYQLKLPLFGTLAVAGMRCQLRQERNGTAPTTLLVWLKPTSCSQQSRHTVASVGLY